MCAHFCYELVIDGEVTLSFMRTTEGGHWGFVSEASCSDCINVLLMLRKASKGYFTISWKTIYINLPGILVHISILLAALCAIVFNGLFKDNAKLLRVKKQSLTSQVCPVVQLCFQQREDKQWNTQKVVAAASVPLPCCLCVHTPCWRTRTRSCVQLFLWQLQMVGLPVSVTVLLRVLFLFLACLGCCHCVVWPHWKWGLFLC